MSLSLVVEESDATARRRHPYIESYRLSGRRSRIRKNIGLVVPHQSQSVHMGQSSSGIEHMCAG